MNLNEVKDKINRGLLHGLPSMAGGEKLIFGDNVLPCRCVDVNISLPLYCVAQKTRLVFYIHCTHLKAAWPFWN